MSQSKNPKIIVIGNEKGGAGKTTYSIHLVVGLLDRGYKVVSIDTDARQHSLTSYLNNRKAYNDANGDKLVDMPEHYHIKESNSKLLDDKENEEKEQFNQIMEEAKLKADYIVIDTPGSHTNLSKYAHSHADIVVTPINDSFIDLDVIAKVKGNDFGNSNPSIYSQMLWEQKMERASRDRGSIDWIVVRNRLSNIDAQNKRNVSIALEKLSKRLSFRTFSGFSERVIFRELFLQGLTLLDLTKTSYQKNFSLSHVAARQELRDFLDFLET